MADREARRRTIAKASKLAREGIFVKRAEPIEDVPERDPDAHARASREYLRAEALQAKLISTEAERDHRDRIITTLTSEADQHSDRRVKAQAEAGQLREALREIVAMYGGEEAVKHCVCGDWKTGHCPLCIARTALQGE